MRIIAGSAGSIPLATPKSPSIRPAADRTRSAIFSSLGDSVIEAKVLDLFAGTGSMGLEALSRGASDCVFVDKGRESLDLLEKNMAKTRLQGTVMAEEWSAALSRLAHSGRKFDIIFADPPFWKEQDIHQNIKSNPERRQYSTEILANADIRTMMTPGGWLVLDSYHTDEFDIPPFWSLRRDRIYGQVRVQFLTPA